MFIRREIEHVGPTVLKSILDTWVGLIAYLATRDTHFKCFKHFQNFVYLKGKYISSFLLSSFRLLRTKYVRYFIPTREAKNTHQISCLPSNFFPLTRSSKMIVFEDRQLGSRLTIYNLLLNLVFPELWWTVSTWLAQP